MKNAPRNPILIIKAPIKLSLNLETSFSLGFFFLPSMPDLRRAPAALKRMSSRHALYTSRALERL